MGNLKIITRHEELIADRRQAAQMLNVHLAEYYGRDDVVVLGIPRGGVVLAGEIAKKLEVRLDVVLARKIGAPGRPEVAIGAVCEDGHAYLNNDIMTALRVSEDYIREEKNRRFEEIEWRKKLYRSVLEKAPLKSRTVILIDDGIATGATMGAAVWICHAEQAARIVIALPVGPAESLEALAGQADELICLCAPPAFEAVGQYYTQFEPVSDDEVIDILSGKATLSSRGL